MAGFRKAKPKQAALKMGFYGAPGSGKTFTSLLIAEGLAALTGKRTAYVDTERGTDFYCQEVSERPVHPAAFDFDAIYTRSISEVFTAVRGLPTDEYGVVIIDSITHLWEAARNAYTGKTAAGGQIPFHAWGKIKKPYKDLLAFLLSSPMHMIICGRQGNEYGDDPDTGELKNLGYKMKAEGETPYEPHILIRMEAVRQPGGKPAIITAYAEKDRSGVLSGKTFATPTFDMLVTPILPYLGVEQAKVETQDETATIDAEAITDADKEAADRSIEVFDEWSARLTLAKTAEEVMDVGKQITPAVKRQMSTAHVSSLKSVFHDRQKAVA